MVDKRKSLVTNQELLNSIFLIYPSYLIDSCLPIFCHHQHKDCLSNIEQHLALDTDRNWNLARLDNTHYPDHIYCNLLEYRYEQRVYSTMDHQDLAAHLGDKQQTNPLHLQS